MLSSSNGEKGLKIRDRGEKKWCQDNCEQEMNFMTLLFQFCIRRILLVVAVVGRYDVDGGINAKSYRK